MRIFISNCPTGNVLQNKRTNECILYKQTKSKGKLKQAEKLKSREMRDDVEGWRLKVEEWRMKDEGRGDVEKLILKGWGGFVTD